MGDIRTTSHFDSDGDNSAQAARSSGGFVDYIHVFNSNTSEAFLQLFDAETGDVTVGTTTPTHSFLIPAGDGTNRGGFEVQLYRPIHFRTAIAYACTTTATGSGDPTTGLTVNIVHH